MKAGGMESRTSGNGCRRGSEIETKLPGGEANGDDKKEEAEGCVEREEETEISTWRRCMRGARSPESGLQEMATAVHGSRTHDAGLWLMEMMVRSWFEVRVKRKAELASIASLHFPILQASHHLAP